ncbi:hypothetical protein [Methylobacterium sp. CM6247]
MANDRSKDWKRAEAAFAKTQNIPKSPPSHVPTDSMADTNTAQLKAARLARDAAESRKAPQRTK